MMCTLFNMFNVWDMHAIIILTLLLYLALFSHLVLVFSCQKILNVSGWDIIVPFVVMLYKTNMVLCLRSGTYM